MLQDELRRLPVFSNFSDEQLACLRDAGQPLTLEQGELLFSEGEPAQGLFVLLEGTLEISKTIGGQKVILSNAGAGVFVGEISLLTDAPHNATARMLTPGCVLKFDVSLFDDLKASPVAALLLSTMADRLRATESIVQQHEKLSSLGRMSAGLAHELNNPASASLRAAKQLPETLSTLQSLVFRLNDLNLSREQFQYLAVLQDTLMRRAASPKVMDTLEQSDREQELADWMDVQGIEAGWRIAPVLVQADVTTDELDALYEKLGDGALNEALTWLEGMLMVIGLVRMIDTSTTQIADLVKAIKAYSYMDQGAIQEIDLHEGLENTLTMLRHKLRNVTVTREYDHSIPKVTAYGGELNQVWTNLIDNAVDAMGGTGTLQVRTSHDADSVRVEIIDNGPGIPPDVQARMFEPFFTTKEIGKGTGLGLDISRRIIVDHHRGKIAVESEPGNTRFIITLPLRQTANDSKA